MAQTTDPSTDPSTELSSRLSRYLTRAQTGAPLNPAAVAYLATLDVIEATSARASRAGDRPGAARPAHAPQADRQRELLLARRPAGARPICSPTSTPRVSSATASTRAATTWTPSRRRRAALACELFGAEHAYVQPHSGADANLVAFSPILAARVEAPLLAELGARGRRRALARGLERAARARCTTSACWPRLLLGRPPDARLPPQPLGAAVRRLPLRRRSRNEAARSGRAAHAAARGEAADPARRLQRLPAPDQLREDARDGGRSRRGAYGRHGALRGAGRGQGLHRRLRPGPARPRRHVDDAQDAARPARRPGPLQEGIRGGRGQGLPDGPRRAAAPRHGRQGRRVPRGLSPAFEAYAHRIVENAARAGRGAVRSKGMSVLTGGTDNHLLLVDVAQSFGLTGRQAESALRECRFTLNRNSLPGDANGPWYTSGLRVGTPAVTTLGMGTAEMREIAAVAKTVLAATKPGPGADGQPSKAKYLHRRERCAGGPFAGGGPAAVVPALPAARRRSVERRGRAATAPRQPEAPGESRRRSPAGAPPARGDDQPPIRVVSSFIPAARPCSRHRPALARRTLYTGRAASRGAGSGSHRNI